MYVYIYIYVIGSGKPLWTEMKPTYGHLNTNTWWIVSRSKQHWNLYYPGRLMGAGVLVPTFLLFICFQLMLYMPVWHQFHYWTTSEDDPVLYWDSENCMGRGDSGEIWKSFIRSLWGVDRFSLSWWSGRGLLEVYWGWITLESCRGHGSF